MEEVRQILFDRARETGNEVGALILQDGRAVLQEGNSYSIAFQPGLHDLAVGIIHTHPHPLSFSLQDLEVFLMARSVKWVEVILLPDGGVHRLTKTRDMSYREWLYADADLEKVYYRELVDRWHRADGTPTKADTLRRIWAVDRVADAFALEFKIVTLDKFKKG
jgi:hypothetical protein